MTVTLREYQRDGVNRLQTALTEHRSAVYVLPTGGGKTVVAGEVARLASQSQRRTLLLVHRRELITQAVDTLRQFVAGVTIGIEANGFPPTPWAPLQVGMVTSLVRRKRDLQPDIVIVDEAHHARAETWATVLARYPNAWRIGLTATPQRLDGQGLHEHFRTLVLGPSIKELVALDALAPTKVKGLPPIIDVKQLKRRSFGDYSSAEIDKQIDDKVMAATVNSYLKHANGLSAIFFASSVQHSMRTVDEFRARGVAAEHVDGTDRAQRRDRVMDAFRRGEVRVVSNVDLISEGFDAPGCECVLLGRPTQSLTKYLQQCGRAMRPGVGKTALILDLVGNYREHGLPDDDRVWSLDDSMEWRGPATYVCKTCKTLLEPKAVKPRMTECPECGTPIDYRTYNPDDSDGWSRDEVDIDLIDIDKGMQRKKVQYGKMSRGDQMNHVYKMFHRQRGPDDPTVRQELEAFAVDKGYKPGWVNMMLRLMRNAEAKG